MSWQRQALDPQHGQRLPDWMVDAITAANDAAQDEIAARLGRPAAIAELEQTLHIIRESLTGDRDDPAAQGRTGSGGAVA